MDGRYQASLGKACGNAFQHAARLVGIDPAQATQRQLLPAGVGIQCFGRFIGALR